MSVLIEETSLVAKKDDLERALPGGITGFIEAALELSPPPRFVCDGDAHLLSLSFHDRMHARGTIELLKESEVNWVLVDAVAGPSAPISWIEWAPDAGGVARAWLAGMRPGDLAIPEGWSVETRHTFDVVDIDVGERLLRLAEEGGVETFLDLGTGAQITTGTSPDVPVAPPCGTPIHDALISALNGIGWTHYLDDAPSASVDLSGKTGIYSNRYVAYEAADLLVCFTRAPLIIPVRARRKVMEFITRANWGTNYGNFDFGLDDGKLGYRSSADVEDGFLSVAIVRNLASNSAHMFDTYYPQLLEVVYGKKSPKDAIEEAEGK